MKILWLKTELLHPVDKGGKIRTYQMLRELKKAHHITYLTLDDGSATLDAREQSAEYAHETITIPHTTSAKFSAKFYFELANNFISKLPYALQKYVSPKMRTSIIETINSNNFDIIVCDFLTPAVNLPADIKAATLLFQHNVEAMIWRRHFEVTKNAAKKAYMKIQWQKMFDYEKEACRNFNWIAAVSKEDADIMRSNYCITNISDIPTGVDTDFFCPDGNVEKDEFNLVFTGSMDWLPNDDAIHWFVEEILPLIRDRIPKISLTIVGRNPSQRLLELSKKEMSIIVTGRVEDVRPFMNKASVYVVPIRIGGGTRLKIYEAMAMELPVVSTTIGAEGLPIKNDVEINLCDTPHEFAEAVIKLLTEKKVAKTIASKAAKKVREEFGWIKAANDFTEICEYVVKSQEKR